jgi:hypothetical protein
MEDYIKLGLREISCEDGRWVKLAQDRIQLRALVLAVLKFQVLSPSFLSSLKIKYSIFQELELLISS